MEGEAGEAGMICVRDLLGESRLEGELRLLAGQEGLGRPVSHPRIQKSGLVMVGHPVGVVPSRIQILGETELSFIEDCTPTLRAERARAMFSLGLSCVVVTRGVSPPSELIAEAQATQTPLMVSSSRSSATIRKLHLVLDRLLAPREKLHGVMVEVHGVGILLRGPSGIGKSECALFLVERGHRLVADDRVILTRLPNEELVAAPEPLLRHHLEVRGLGVLNIRDLFGATAVWDEVGLDLVVDLCRFEDGAEYERLGVDEPSVCLLGVHIPQLLIPVRPGRDMGVILEVAARNQLLKQAGHHAARDFARRLSRHLREKDS